MSVCYDVTLHMQQLVQHVIAANLLLVSHAIKRTRGVRKVLQVDMLEQKTFQNLYTNRTRISLKLL